MWKGFNVEIEEAFFKEKITGTSLSLWDKFIASAKEFRARCQRDIQTKIVSGKWVLDGVGIESNWFPKLSNHVFISHSHADEQLALALAGALKEWLKIDSFVDSAIWGHFEELQTSLFKKIAQGRSLEAIEEFKLWNTVSSHVHCMLSKSLIQMIDQCECLIFLNTPSSIQINEIEGRTSTYSPWIYTEIEVSRFLRKMPDPRRPNEELLKESFAQDAAIECRVEYPLNLDHLLSKTGVDIWNWICSGYKALNNDASLAEGQEAFCALDALYAQ